jgi:hypothetical protein
MNSSTESFIRSNADKTVVQIVALLQSQAAVTVNPIPLASLEAYLNSRGLLEQVKLVAQNEQTPPEVAIGLKSFLDHLASTRQVNLDTTDPTIAAITATVLGGLKEVGIATDENVEAIYTLGSGLKFEAVRESDVQALLDRIAVEKAEAEAAAQRATVLDELQSRVQAVYGTFVNDRINTARADVNLPLPTWEEFVEAVNQ